MPDYIRDYPNKGILLSCTVEWKVFFALEDHERPIQCYCIATKPVETLVNHRGTKAPLSSQRGAPWQCALLLVIYWAISQKGCYQIYFQGCGAMAASICFIQDRMQVEADGVLNFIKLYMLGASIIISSTNGSCSLFSKVLLWLIWLNTTTQFSSRLLSLQRLHTKLSLTCSGGTPGDRIMEQDVGDKRSEQQINYAIRVFSHDKAKTSSRSWLSLSSR